VIAKQAQKCINKSVFGKCIRLNDTLYQGVTVTRTVNADKLLDSEKSPLFRILKFYIFIYTSF